jgi:hypothetical protein
MSVPGKAPASLLPPFSSPRFTALPPLSLYVHIPWCVRKCPYCDFNSHEARNGVPEQEYVAALTADLEQALPLVWGRKVGSIFFGGGTPSLFSPHGMDTILSMVRARRNHAGSQPRHVRSRKIPRFPRNRHQPAFDRHPEFQSRASAGAGAHTRRARGGPRDRNRPRAFR